VREIDEMRHDITLEDIMWMGLMVVGGLAIAEVYYRFKYLPNMRRWVEENYE
jgi:hypothetical protein